MKVGIVGSGNIVPEFLQTTKEIKDFEIISISATPNSVERMKNLSEKYKIKSIYTSYDEMLENEKEIEVVYIAVPNNLHFEFTKKAINSGKDVILEKPFTSNFNEANELIKLAQKNNKIVFEAISNQYLPNYEKTKELLSELGDIKIVQLNYSQYSSRYDRFKAGDIAPAFDPKKSGGALMDLNLYNIYFTIGLFGKPEKVFYTANIEKNIDTSGILVLMYPTFKCVCIGAKDCKSPISLNIQGDKGFIHSDDAPNIFNKFIFGKNDGKIQEFELNNEKHRLYFEFLHFAKLYKNREKEIQKFFSYNEKSLLVMKILDMAKKDVGLEF